MHLDTQAASWCAVVMATICTGAWAAQPADPPPTSPPADKDDYTLVDPTPRELWRPLSADRPDTTESPYTVDAGAVQLELSFVDYARNGDDETWVVAPVNLKVGLTNRTDIQFVFDPYVHIDSGSGDAEGVGDTQIRLKVNLWGNDHGRTALAAMPFVKLPTADGDVGNDEFEGGLIVPWSTALTDRIGLGLMGEIDIVYDDVDDEHDLQLVTTAVLGFELNERWGAYVEGIGIVRENEDFQAIVGTGVTYAIDANVVLDGGINVGLTGDADDVNLFAGITVRF